jgi:hypothetical protein
MEPYSEEELIEFGNICIKARRNVPDHYVVSQELYKWKETLKQKRRDKKINELLK